MSISTSPPRKRSRNGRTEDEDEEVDLGDEGTEPVSLGDTSEEEEDSDEWADQRR